MKIISWNINSIKARLHFLSDWLTKHAPDILFLQELKLTNDQFPTDIFEAQDYKLAINGQKAYNGVAIASKYPMEVILDKLPGDDTDEQARYLEVEVNGIRFINIYLPNGNPLDTDKYTYKLSWMKRLKAHLQSLIEQEVPFIIGGDFNVIPHEKDVYHPEDWADDALYRLETRNAFREICYLGLTEAFHALHPHHVQYTFWDYQKGRWAKNEGIRIDHFLLSPQLADQLQSCHVDEETRGLERPSDHAPIHCELTIFDQDYLSAFSTNLAKLSPSQ